MSICFWAKRALYSHAPDSNAWLRPLDGTSHAASSLLFCGYALHGLPLQWACIFILWYWFMVLGLRERERAVDQRGPNFCAAARTWRHARSCKVATCLLLSDWFTIKRKWQVFVPKHSAVQKCLSLQIADYRHCSSLQISGFKLKMINFRYILSTTVCKFQALNPRWLSVPLIFPAHVATTVRLIFTIVGLGKKAMLKRGTRRKKKIMGTRIVEI